MPQSLKEELKGHFIQVKNKNSIENFEEEICLKICNTIFRNEIDLDQYIELNALSGIIFVNCRFEELDLLERFLDLVILKIINLII